MNNQFDITKQSPFPWMDTNSDAWKAIVKYVTYHDDDIERGIDDFATLRPVLEHFSRNSFKHIHQSETIIKHDFGKEIL